MPKTKKRRVEEEPMEVDDAAQSGPSCSNQNGIPDDDIDHISDDEEGGIRVGDIYIPPPPKPALTFDPDGPRLLITHIVNENFKSYAGVQYLGPFHKCFSSIIGPNGSGKSNVIDSMLFVFGYRAAKMRSKKVATMVHLSSKFPHITHATVAVHFCKIIDLAGDDFEVVPNSEFVIARTAGKDNSSVYTIDGHRANFREVTTLLRSYGIDLDHNRFLILQGEVEQIAMMKPKGQTEHDAGMLEYLEDIIGTSRYKRCIEQLAVKVEEYCEMRKEKLNRVRLVEQEKEKLEQPMREAVELMNLTNTALRTRNTLLQKYIHETNKIIAGKETELTELKNGLTRLDEKLNDLTGKLEEKNTELRAGTQVYDDLHRKKEETAEKLQTCKRKTVTVQADTTQGKKKRRNLQQLLEQERGKRIELELIPDKNRREISECEMLLRRHSDNKRVAEAELETVMAGVRSTTQGLQEQKDRLQARLIDLKKIVDESNQAFKLAESELKIYLSTETKEEHKLTKMKEAYEKAARDLREKTAQQEELESTVPTNERQLHEAQTKLQALKREESSSSNEARSLRAQLEESRQAMSANRSRNRVLDALMREKSNGHLPGIFGRLGDLGGIDTRYDIAISTCCGALDNIVVDTVETAQACVEHLKRHDIGRATFIALDKQQHLRHQYERKITYPQNVPRLFDLVRVRDDRVLPAFYYALRDTLVAKDLDQASRIAYGQTRYRVVTENGDVIEIAGTMSGGGRSVMRGRMSSSVQQDTSEQDPRVIQANENKLAELEERLTQLRGEQVTLEDSVVSAQRSIREGKSSLHKLNVELRSLTEQVPVLQNQIDQQEGRVAASRVDEQQKGRLEAALRAAEEKLEEARHDAGEVEEEVHGVDAEISAVAGGRVKDLRKNVNELAKKIDKVSTEITKLNVAINTSIRNSNKSRDKITQMETDLRDTEATLESLNSQKRQLSLDTDKFQKELEELDEQINEGTEEFTGLRQEIARLQSKQNKVKSERLEANNAVQKMEKSIHDCTTKIPMWDRELRALRLEDPGLEGIPGVEQPDPLVTHTPEELEEALVDELRNRLAAQKARLGDAKPNIQAIQDYKTKEELYLRRAAELDSITTKRNEMRTLFDDVKKRRTNEFMIGFTTITAKLKEMYQMITLGGDAELELVDSLDAFTEGIIFSVRPPNKSWKNISNLSGGEKTLSSLALVFALHYYKPTPLYVLDEIDAALDFKNVSIVANYIKERTRNAQFIIISLRYNMFEVSHRLVGIYKTEDCTKSITIDNKIPEELAEGHAAA